MELLIGQGLSGNVLYFLSCFSLFCNKYETNKGYALHL